MCGVDSAALATPTAPSSSLDGAMQDCRFRASLATLLTRPYALRPALSSARDQNHDRQKQVIGRTKVEPHPWASAQSWHATLKRLRPQRSTQTLSTTEGDQCARRIKVGEEIWRLG